MRRWRRRLVLGGCAVLAAVAAAVGSIALNVATGGAAHWFPTMDRLYLWWATGSAAAVAATGLLLLAAQRWYERELVALVPHRQGPEPWVLMRPGEVRQIVHALRRRRGASVGITTALHGAGGFGKSTVARLVRADPRVLRWFRGRVYWVTVGRDVHRAALVEKVNDLVRQVDPVRAQPFTDLRQAAEHLAAVLAVGPRRLIIIDDVWFEEQLAAFPVAGRCARLVTTRNPSLVTGRDVRVEVDQMSWAQARRLLTTDLEDLGPPDVEELLRETGRWPLLLRLANRILLSQMRAQLDGAAAARALAQQLRRGGALQADTLTGAAGRPLNVSDPERRHEAIAATIEASAGLLTADERARFTELSVFAEDEAVPLWLVAALWQETGGMDATGSRALCARLADLALLSLTATSDGGDIRLHDTIRDFLLADLGAVRVQRLHNMLLEVLARPLPTAQPARAPGPQMVAWWRLPPTARYVWEHLVEHFVSAGRRAEVETLATDLRWVGARLEQASAEAPLLDLSILDSPQAAGLQRLYGQLVHLLGPTSPGHSRADILHLRVSDDPTWGPQARSLAQQRTQPRFATNWLLPDRPDQALRRTLASPTGAVWSVAIAPDGSWFAAAGNKGSLRLYDSSGEQLAELVGHTDVVRAVAVAPDGSWLASGSDDHTVRIWSTARREQLVELRGHNGSVWAVAVAPDGSWLASAGTDGTVRIWDVATPRPRAVIRGHRLPIRALAVAPDGSWLASGGDDGAVRLWYADTGRLRRELLGHQGWVWSTAIASHGGWLASAGNDGIVQIWDAATGEQRGELTANARGIRSVAIAPDDSWLISAGLDGAVRVWDVVSGTQHRELDGHVRPVWTVAIDPHGRWLASGSDDEMVRLWDLADRQAHPHLPPGRTVPVRAVTAAPDGGIAAAGDDGTIRVWEATGTLRTELATHTASIRAMVASPGFTRLVAADDSGLIRWYDMAGRELREPNDHGGTVRSLTVAPDGRWVASAGDDGVIRVWDTQTGELRRTLSGHDLAVRAVVVAPDGTWLATAGDDGTVRIWDAATGVQRLRLVGHVGIVRAVAVASDGTWIASAGNDRAIRLWTPAGRLLGDLAGHTAWIRSVSIDPSGRHIASTGDDRTVRIWSTQTLRPIAMTRLEHTGNTCVWSGTDAIIVGGTAGLYHFAIQNLSSAGSPGGG